MPECKCAEKKTSTEVKIKKLNKDAVIPKYAHKGDAGADLVSVEDWIVKSGSTVVVDTGIALEIPMHYEVQIRPRSGLAAKHGITVQNSPGTIDCGYRGRCMVILHNTSKEDFHVTKGMRIAQMVVCKLPEVSLVEVDELSDTERGEGGLGSTGTKS